MEYGSGGIEISYARVKRAYSHQVACLRRPAVTTFQNQTKLPPHRISFIPNAINRRQQIVVHQLWISVAGCSVRQGIGCELLGSEIKFSFVDVSARYIEPANTLKTAGLLHAQELLPRFRDGALVKLRQT